MRRYLWGEQASPVGAWASAGEECRFRLEISTFFSREIPEGLPDGPVLAGRPGGVTRASKSCARTRTRVSASCGNVSGVHRVEAGALRPGTYATLLLVMDLLIEHRSYPSLFRTGEAEERGVSRHHLRYDPRFSAVTAGIHRDEVRCVEHPTPSWADEKWMEESLRLRAMAMVVPGIVAGGATAARLFGLPLPHRLIDEHLHLVTFDPGRKVARKGTTVRRHAREEAGYWLELPMHSPVGVFLDLSAELTRDELVALGDAIVGGWHGPPLCSLEFLRTKSTQRNYLRQRAQVESALSFIREDVDSPQETNLRLWALSRGLPEPVVHPQVYCRLLNRTVEPDLGYPHVKLALEYEGEHHLLSKSQWASDIARDEALRHEGWEVLRVTSQMSRAELERKIRYHLEQKAGGGGR